MTRYPLHLRIALAVGGAAVAGYLGAYAAWSWYRASREEREQLVTEYFEVFIGGSYQECLERAVPSADEMRSAIAKHLRGGT